MSLREETPRDTSQVAQGCCPLVTFLSTDGTTQGLGSAGDRNLNSELAAATPGSQQALDALRSGMDEDTEQQAAAILLGLREQDEEAPGGLIFVASHLLSLGLRPQGIVSLLNDTVHGYVSSEAEALRIYQAL